MQARIVDSFRHEADVSGRQTTISVGFTADGLGGARYRTMTRVKAATP